MQVKVKTYELPPIDERVTLLYAGVKKAEDTDINLIRDCAKEYLQTAGKVCYLICPIKICADQVTFTFGKVKSKSLSQRLNGCNYAVVFASTIGIEIDRLIKKYTLLAPTKAVIFQALGAERIECLCDIFNGEINDSAVGSGGTTKPRFSAGYGDLPLETQKQIFAVLDCPKRIGLTLNESLLMSPSKSVTAFAGISDKPTEKPIITNKCALCDKKDCAFRGAL